MKFNIISESMPKTVQIGDREYEINADFRVGIEADGILKSPGKDEDKILRLLKLYYPVIPEDVSAAVDKMLWFYRSGEETEETKKDDQKRERYRRRASKEPVYSFSQDASYVYTAFLEQYGIDLSSVEYLHWWKFIALFDSLSEDTKMSRIMYYRMVSTTGMSKERRAFINEMKKLYKINPTAHKLTLEQRNQRWKDYIKYRHNG